MMMMMVKEEKRHTGNFFNCRSFWKPEINISLLENKFCHISVFLKLVSSVSMSVLQLEAQL